LEIRRGGFKKDSQKNLKNTKKGSYLLGFSMEGEG
jgi:hypothetical protein